MLRTPDDLRPDQTHRGWNQELRADDAGRTRSQTGGRVEAPAWLIKWAALTLEYVEMEKALLPGELFLFIIVNWQFD